jgi:hypothetical protein
MFLLPFVFVGYNIYDKHKKKEEAEEERKKNGPQTPESVDGPVFVDGTTELLRLETTSTADSDSSDSNSSKGEQESDSDIVREQEGPFRGIRKFFAEARENDPFRIKTNQDNLTFEVMGNQGDMALNFPKISFK